MGQGQIRQLSRSVDFGGREDVQKDAGDQKVTHEYFVNDIWPSEISSIDLSYDSSDAIEEFTVTFQVEYITSIGVQSDLNSTQQLGNGGDDSNTDLLTTSTTTGLL